MQIRSRFVAGEFKGGEARLACGDSPAGGALRAVISIDACRCFLFILPCQSSEARAGEIAGRGLLRKGQMANRTAEE